MKTYGLTQAQQNFARKIAEFVVSHGRVACISGGELSMDSLEQEVITEAFACGYNHEEANAIGKFAADCYE